MLRSVLRLSRATATTAARRSLVGPISLKFPRSRFLHAPIDDSNANPVALQMIDYALSLAKSQKSDESCAQGILVLEQCVSSQSSEGPAFAAQNSKGMALLAMSDIFYARGNYGDAMEKLENILDLSDSSLSVRVAGFEALGGLNLELGQDDAASVIMDKCLELVTKNENKAGGDGVEFANSRAKAVKGLVDLIRGDVQSAESCFGGFNDEHCVGTAALSYGVFLHGTHKYSLAKDLYERAIQGVAQSKDFTDINSLAACNMASQEVLLAATCALGQLEAHMGKFEDAEKTLTSALNKAEELFGSRHPKVGVILTCLALMFRHKAKQEGSSSLLLQEGLYRRAIELLKTPSIDSDYNAKPRTRRDVTALAQGGYAETLCVQENRKGEGEKIKRWSESAWTNSRISLSEALKIPDSSDKIPVIDTRVCRVV